MSIQTRKTFIHLWNTNEDLFDEICEISIDSYTTDTLKLQKVYKGKLILMN